MRIKLESNFMLLGSEDIDGIDFDSHEITLKQLLEAITRRSTHSPQFLNRDKTDLTSGWDIRVNGRAFGMCEQGIDTMMKDGDGVAINIEMLGGG